MSAIATTTAVPIDALPALQAAAAPRKSLLGGRKDEFPLALARHGRPLELFEFSGYVLETVLAYLSERGVDLVRSRHEEVARAITSARGSTYVILGEEHRALAQKLTDAQHAPAELAKFFNEMNAASEDPDVGEAMLGGIRFLRRALDAVDRETVVLVGIV